MKKFELAQLPELTKEQLNGILQFGKAQGFGEKEIYDSIAQLADDCVFLNDVYQVNVRCFAPGEFIHLSIKRIDKKPIHDWRDLQAIKNELVGSENEAVELYPAESRLVDSANQYHLWVAADPNFRFPFGFDGPRVVSDEDYNTGSKQREF